MKIALSLWSLLLFVFLSLDSMQEDNKFLSVRAGGYSINTTPDALQKNYACQTMYHQGDELICTIIAQDQDVLRVAQEDMLKIIKIELGKSLNVQNALEVAAGKYYSPVKDNNPQLLMSLFSIESQCLSVLSINNLCAVYGGKNCKSTHHDEEKFTQCCNVYQYSDNFGYYLGASDDFWKVINRKKISGLLFDAKTMPKKDFYAKHAHGIIPSTTIDKQISEDEDQEACEIAKKLTDIAIFRGGKDITLVLKLLGSSKWEINPEEKVMQSTEIDMQKTDKEVLAFVKKIPVRTWVYSFIGKRAKNEDRYIEKRIKYNDNKYYCTGIFDGHSGSGVAELACDKFFDFFENELKQGSSVKKSLQYACSECEKLTKAEELQFMGSTVLATCFNQGSGKLSLLWLGDSQAFVEDFFKTTAHVATNDKERERITKNGDCVTNGKLNGIIEVSRSLGDAMWKKKIPLSAEWEIKTHKVFENYGEGFEKVDSYFIGASDGFWNVMKDENDIIQCLEDAYKLSHTEFYEKYQYDKDDEHLMECDQDLISDEEENEGNGNLAQRLTYIAQCRKSADNTTVIVQVFGEPNFLKDSNASDASSDSNNIMSSLDSLRTFSDLEGAVQNINTPDYESLTAQPKVTETGPTIQEENTAEIIIISDLEGTVQDINTPDDESPIALPKVTEAGPTIQEENTAEIIIIPDLEGTVQDINTPDDESPIAQPKVTRLIPKTQSANTAEIIITPDVVSEAQEDKEFKKESVILPERSFIQKYKYLIGGGIIALCAFTIAVYKYKYAQLYCL